MLPCCPHRTHLKHLLVPVCDWVAGHQVGGALLEGLPGDAGLGLGLLWRARLVAWKNERQSVAGLLTHLHNLRHPCPIWPGLGYIHQALPNFGDVMPGGLIAPMW